MPLSRRGFILWTFVHVGLWGKRRACFLTWSTPRFSSILADTEWRLQRIPTLEMGIYAVGRLEFAGLFANEPEEARKHLIEAKVFLAYQRQLSNLSVQESRLRRQREKDTVALRELQEHRRRQAKARLDSAARKYIQAVHEDRHE